MKENVEFLTAKTTKTVVFWLMNTSSNDNKTNHGK